MIFLADEYSVPVKDGNFQPKEEIPAIIDPEWAPGAGIFPRGDGDGGGNTPSGKRHFGDAEHTPHPNNIVKIYL